MQQIFGISHFKIQNRGLFLGKMPEIDGQHDRSLAELDKNNIVIIE
jgi:hypothetical protein